MISRGDNSITDYLIEVYKQGGKIGAYKSVAKQLNINTDKFVTNQLDLNTNLPWDIIEIYPPKQQLINEYKRLMKRA